MVYRAESFEGLRVLPQECADWPEIPLDMVVLDHPELMAATGDEMIYFVNRDGRIGIFYAVCGRMVAGATAIPWPGCVGMWLQKGTQPRALLVPGVGHVREPVGEGDGLASALVVAEHPFPLTCENTPCMRRSMQHRR